MMIEILNDHIGDPHFGSIISEASDLIKEWGVVGGHGPRNAGANSKALSELHSFRKKMGYYKENRVSGLDDTIYFLSQIDVPLNLSTIETNGGHVALWTSGDGQLLGAMIFRI